MAWLVPTHRSRFSFYTKHYKLSRKYASSFKHFAVVQSTEEAIELRQLTDSYLNIINLEESFTKLQISTYLKSRSIINVKKIFGLLQLYKEFDNIIVTDDEIELFKDIHPNDISEITSISHSFHPTSNKYIERIVCSPLRLIDDSNEKSIIFNDFCKKNYYGWFSNLPIYESKYMDRFFTRFNLNTTEDFDKLVFEDFDYILYQYSLYLDNYDEVNFYFYSWDLPDLGGSLWEMYYTNSNFNKFVLENLKVNPILWIPNKSCKTIVPGAKMIFNIDRDYSRPKLNFYKFVKKFKSIVDFKPQNK